MPLDLTRVNKAAGVCGLIGMIAAGIYAMEVRYAKAADLGNHVQAATKELETKALHQHVIELQELILEDRLEGLEVEFFNVNRLAPTNPEGIRDKENRLRKLNRKINSIRRKLRLEEVHYIHVDDESVFSSTPNLPSTPVDSAVSPSGMSIFSLSSMLSDTSAEAIERPSGNGG